MEQNTQITPAAAAQQNSLLPIATPELAAEAYHQYLQLCQSILIPYDERQVDERGVVIQESDYARIPQSKKDDQGKWITEYKDVPRKSAFRKLARFYGVSTEIVEKKREQDPDTGAITWHYTVKAWQGQVSTMGEASCSTDESKKQRSEHDAKATAHTRAKNRAISDLIGFGQVSAEEIISEHRLLDKQPATQAKKPKPRTGLTPKQNSRKAENRAKVNTKHPDQDEEKVLNAFLDRDLRTTSLIVVKRNDAVWVQHPADYPEEKVIKYEAALTDAELEYRYHENRNAWEVSIK